jgi:hypothetical protein
VFTQAPNIQAAFRARGFTADDTRLAAQSQIIADLQRRVDGAAKLAERVKHRPDLRSFADIPSLKPKRTSPKKMLGDNGPNIGWINRPERRGALEAQIAALVEKKRGKARSKSKKSAHAAPPKPAAAPTRGKKRTRAASSND